MVKVMRVCDDRDPSGRLVDGDARVRKIVDSCNTTLMVVNFCQVTHFRDFPKVKNFPVNFPFVFYLEISGN